MNNVPDKIIQRTKIHTFVLNKGLFENGAI